MILSIEVTERKVITLNHSYGNQIYITIIRLNLIHSSTSQLIVKYYAHLHMLNRNEILSKY